MGLYRLNFVSAHLRCFAPFGWTLLNMWRVECGFYLFYFSMEMVYKVSCLNINTPL